MASLESLEELVYRPTLAEGNRAVQGASPWVSIPVTLTVCGPGAGGHGRPDETVGSAPWS